MEPKGIKHLYSISYQILPKQVTPAEQRALMELVEELEEVKEALVEEALAYTNYEEARAVLAHVMGL